MTLLTRLLGEPLLKFQACAKDVAYLTSTGITQPRDEWKIFLVDAEGSAGAGSLRTTPDDSGRVYRWSRVRSNNRKVPPVDIANDFLVKMMQPRTGLHILGDNRSKY